MDEIDLSQTDITPCKLCKGKNIALASFNTDDGSKAYRVQCACGNCGEMEFNIQAALDSWKNCNGNELQPCPFCGSSGESVYLESETEDDFYVVYTRYYVFCSPCGADGPNANDKQSAIQLWNKRKDK